MTFNLSFYWYPVSTLLIRLVGPPISSPISYKSSYDRCFCAFLFCFAFFLLVGGSWLYIMLDARLLSISVTQHWTRLPPNLSVVMQPGGDPFFSDSLR